ncbi:hypothetical protein Hanom_Chr12g01068141 [Helianthus anomalus]
MSHSQSMPMLWRTLFTIEEILEKERLELGLSELAYLYSLVTHGSNHFLFKTKPHQPIPIHKTTQNVTNFARLTKLPGTSDRAEAFLALDPIVRTFKIRIQDSEEQAQTSFSYIMSSNAQKSTRSATKFGLDDIDSFISPRTANKESKSLSFQEPRAVTTRARSGSKRKKLSEPEGDFFDGFTRVKSHHEKIAELEETLAGMRSITATKEKAFSQLEKDNKGLEEQLLMVEVGTQEAVMVVTDEAKVNAARTVLQARIRMLRKPMILTLRGPPGNLAQWEQSLLKLGGEEELALEKPTEDGTSGVKRMAGGAG